MVGDNVWEKDIYLEYIFTVKLASLVIARYRLCITEDKVQLWKPT